MNTETNESPIPARERSDRRKQPTKPWDVFHIRGRRVRNRRAEEAGKPHFVDRVSRMTFLLAVLLLILTVVDGVITLILLEGDCEEANPLMSYLLSRGPMTFLLGKYALTAMFVPVTMILHRCTMFGTRLRVEILFPIFVLLYLILIAYQFTLLKGGVIL